MIQIHPGGQADRNGKRRQNAAASVFSTIYNHRANVKAVTVTGPTPGVLKEGTSSGTKQNSSEREERWRRNKIRITKNKRKWAKSMFNARHQKKKKKKKRKETQNPKHGAHAHLVNPAPFASRKADRKRPIPPRTHGCSAGPSHALIWKHRAAARLSCLHPGRVAGSPGGSSQGWACL